MNNIKENIQNMVSLYTIDSSIIDGIYGETNVLFFTNDGSVGKLYRGAGKNTPLQYIGSETAHRLEKVVKIFGNDFDGTEDISNNLTMFGTLDNSLGEGIFDKLNISTKLIANGLYLNDRTISFKDSKGNNATLTLDTSTFANLDVEANIVTKIFNTVEEVFDNNINDISDDDIGTTYFVKNGISDIDVPESFVLNDKREIIPTSSYVISSSKPSEKYNYHKGNILWIDKLYSNSNKEDLDNGNGELKDDTIISSKDYYELKKAIDKLYYILGVDLDAGNVEDSENTEGEGVDGGEFNNETQTTRSNYGVILTDLNYNQKTAFNAYNTEEKPEWLAALDDENNEEEKEENVDYDTIVLPDELSEDITNIGEHFVKAIRIKRGKYSDMIAKFDYLLEGELVWCVPERGNNIQSGKLYIKTKDSLNNLVMMPIGGGNSTNDNDKEYLTELVDIEKIDWLNNYRMKINNDGKVIITQISNNPNLEEDNTRKAPKFYINSLYIGGKDSSIGMYRQCSHNFIEISNLTNNDINLEEAGISLQYIDNRYKNGSNLSWKILPLTGTIKAGGTYLIRGAECAPIDCNTTRIKIETYDQEWYDEDKLMSFSDEDYPVFALCSSEKDSNNNILPISETYTDSQQFYKNKKVYDLIGFNIRAMYYEIEPFDINSLYRSTTNIEKYNLTDFIYIKYFTMDGVKQATKAFTTAKNNSKDIYAINLREDYQKNISEYYTGKASYENKNIFYNKSSFEDKPNMIACSFGKKATDDGVSGATRCFNWISKGYYNEYLKLKYPDGSIKYFESFKNEEQNRIYTGQKKISFTLTNNNYYNYDEKGNVVYDENGNSTSRFSYSGIYDRYRDITTSKIPFTVHKLIIDNLYEGKYTYQIGKEEGWSEEYTFIVRSDNDVNSNGIEFIHHSDQQGFNGDEYVAWEVVANYIDEIYKDKNGKYSFDFTINTGDMTQNGNRINEWLDYYQGGKKLFLHSEQMNTVGNNDLSPLDNTKLGDGNDDSKINPKNFDLYYCYDLSIDEQKHLVVKVGENEENKLLPSNYSYDIGDYHFTCVNSEITTNTCKNVYKTNVENISNAIAKWLETDLINASNKRWRIAYCHEMPFTILTNDNTMAKYKDDNETIIYPNEFADRHNIIGNSPSGCHLNCLPIDAIGNIVDDNGNVISKENYKRYYWLSRLFEKYNVSLVLGGHKHTYSSSLPIKENIKDGVLNRDKKEDYTSTYKPIVQLKRSDLTTLYGSNFSDDYLKEKWYNDNIAKCATDPYAYTDTLRKKFGILFQNNICDLNDIEIVDDYNITYPIYVMCQSSGYKLISNKELPGRYIPWLTYPTTLDNQYNKTYYPVDVKDGENNIKELKCNKLQLFPIYIKWNINNESIKGIPLRFSINGKQMFYQGNTNSNGTYQLINEIGYNFYENNKLRELENVDGVSNRKIIEIKKK